MKETISSMVTQALNGFCWGFGVLMAYALVKYVMHIHLP